MISWAYGVTTVVKRLKDPLPHTLKSLAKGGFNSPRLFIDGVESLTGLPYPYHNLPVTMHESPNLGAWGNWILALWELYVRSPKAGRYALFQDDIITSRNIRQYLDECEYPNKGYWNLNTFPSNQDLAPGYVKGKAFGQVGWYLSNQHGKSATALVFSRNAVIALLQQEHIVRRSLSAHRGQLNIDGGVVAAMKKAGYKEYVHNPSLIQHVNAPSTIGHGSYPLAESFMGENFDAMELLSEQKNRGVQVTQSIPAAPPTPKARANRIGLVGYNAPCGLGTKNRQLATYLPIDRWLVKPHRSGKSFQPHPDVDTIVCPNGDRRKIEDFVRSVDVVLFDETPYYKELIPIAKQHGRRLVCIPEYEWTPKNGWPQQVDLFLCPTRQSYSLLSPTLPCTTAPWPVDVNAFVYRERQKCERFLFINGTGGWHGRKGSSVIKQSLNLWPEMPLIVYSQKTEGWPADLSSLSYRGSAESNGCLYDEGDVLLCPHSVDGTGLEPLEAMACGMPVIATDGLPWNELPLIGRIKSTVEQRNIARRVDWHTPSAESLVAQCKGWLGKDLSEASERVWNWARNRRWDKQAAGFTDLVLNG